MNAVAGWKSKPLSQLLALILDFRGKTPKKLGMQWGDGDIPALSANNVEMGKIDLSKECYFGSDALYRKWMTKGDTRSGDIILTTEAPLGNVAQIPDGRRYILSQRTILLRADENQLSNDYLRHYISSDEFQHLMRQQSSGTTATGIQRAKLEPLPIRFPVSMTEQAEIARILATVDSVIENTDALLAKRRRIKTGVIEDLLTRGIDKAGNLRSEDTHEFKDSWLGRIPVEWDVKRIGEVFDIQLGKMLSQKASVGKSPFAYLGNKNVQWDFVDSNDLQKMDFDERERSKYALRVGDILVCEGGEVGRTCLWRGEVEPCYFQKAIHRLRPIDEQYLPRLFPHFMRWAVRRGILADFVSQTSIAHLTQEKLSAVPIIVPPPEDQTRISISLDATDSAGYYLQAELKKLRRLKTGLIQDLLTGKKRVTALLEPSPHLAVEAV